MHYDQPVTWDAQSLDKGLLTRVLKLNQIDAFTNKLEPYGVSPFSGRPMIGKKVNTIMGFEGITGINTANATQTYGKKGTLLRRKVRIDKCPWVNGEDDIRLRITIGFGHTIGTDGASAPPAVFIRRWLRNSKAPFEETFQSNVAPATDLMRSEGFSDASAGITVYLAAHDALEGFFDPEHEPFVWDSENGLIQSYVHCRYFNPTFTQSVTYIAMYPPYERNNYIDCPTWSKHRLNFSDGIVSVKYNDGFALGIVQGVGATVEAIGWDTGFWDIDGYHEGTTLDPYISMEGTIISPNSYEYPNYPVDSPYNPTGEGVG